MDDRHCRQLVILKHRRTGFLNPILHPDVQIIQRTSIAAAHRVIDIGLQDFEKMLELLT